MEPIPWKRYIEKVCFHFEGASKEKVKEDIISLLNRLEEDNLIILDYNPLFPTKF